MTVSSASGDIRVDVHAGVATIRLERPPANALSARTVDQLAAAIAEVGARTDLAAVVVHGGRAAFSIGADLDELKASSGADVAAAARRCGTVFSALANLPQPTVAAVCGYALGAGLEIALCCDRRVAAGTAQLGMPEVRLGLIPGAGGTQRLARLVGPARAKELVMTGRTVGAEEAMRLGIVDEVVAPADVYAAAAAWAAQFERLPHRAVQAGKRAVDEGVARRLEDGLKLEADLFASLARERNN